MNWKPSTSHYARQQRAIMLQAIRAFFFDRQVLEVETPALSLAGNTDPFIESFQLKDRGSKYLHTSPEYPMKRLLAAGSGDIYQICKVWRAGEAGKNHNPEFTLLEWYRVDYRYYQLMQEVDQLLRTLLQNLTDNTQFLSYETLFLEKFGFNPHIAKHDELIACVSKNISGLDCEGLTSQAMLDALLTHCIEPDFDKTGLTFVYDYPVSQSALAQLRDRQAASAGSATKIVKSGGDVFNKNANHDYEERFHINNQHPVAERFEVYLGQMELGNGYQEEVSYERNKQILKHENEVRKQTGLDPVTEDENFLMASKSGIPHSAGVAIGLDRVLMCILDVDSIQEVINFPWDKA